MDRSSQSTLSRSDFISALTTTYLFRQLNEDALEALHTDWSLVDLPKDHYLFHEGDPSDALYIVLKGRLRAIQPSSTKESTVLGDIHPGEIVGEMQLLVGGSRTADVHAPEPSQLIRLPKRAFETVVERFPDIASTMTDLVIQRLRQGQLKAMLPALFGTTDADMLSAIEKELEWVRLRPGDVLFRQGDAGDGMFILVSGSLHVILETTDGRREMIDHVTRGQCVGELAILNGEPRSADVCAVRQCELAKFSKPAFERIVAAHPELMRAITDILLRRLQKTNRPRSQKPTSINIAVVPISRTIRPREFTERLATHLSAYGECGHLNAARIDALMGCQDAAQIAPEDLQSLRLSALLDDQEYRWRYVLYEADPNTTQWTAWCLQRADRILLIADANDTPAVRDNDDARLMAMLQEVSAGKTLILLHPNGDRQPRGTGEWLTHRRTREFHHLRWNLDSDFKRLARFISGHAVGLVFSGGGARGFAHFGVYLALREAGVPIDMIGGASMGSVLGIQIAMDWDRDTMLKVNRRLFREQKVFKQYTLPLFSLINSRKLNQSMKRNTPGAIEDLWMRFFCVSCDLTATRMVLHERGPIWKAVRASVSIPGVLEPMASEEGHLLVDGGLANNLPADVMRRYCGTVIAVDVTRVKELQVNPSGFPNPWKALMDRILPFRKPAATPSIIDVLMGATTISLREKSKQVILMSDLYLRPPVDEFSMLDFDGLEKLVDIGYDHAKQEVEEWIRNCNPLPWQPHPPGTASCPNTFEN